jgi:Dolichyl-phosphate-mannose-protein mannosyltransferase
MSDSKPSVPLREQHPRRVWITYTTVALVALTTRLAYWFTTRDAPLSSDAGTYHELATNLVEGRGFSHTFPQVILHPTAFRPPAYPFVLSAVYRLTGPSPGVGRGLGVMIGVIVVLLTLWVVKRHAGVVAAAVAALIVAVYPPLIANDTVTLAEGPSLALLLLLVDRVLERQWIAVGVLGGLLTLTRPSAQMLILVIVGWLLVKAGRKAALGALAVAVAVVAPWVIRNAVVLDAPIVVTSNGFNLSAIYSPTAQRVGAFVDPVTDPELEGSLFDQLDEAEWDRRLRQRALDNIREHPQQVVKVIGRNTLAFLEIKPSFNEQAEVLDGRDMTVRTVTMPLFYLVTAAGTIGLWRSRRSDLTQLLILVSALFAAGSLLLVAPPRLRAPFDLAACIGAGLLVASFVRPSSDPGSVGDDETETAALQPAPGAVEGEGGHDVIVPTSSAEAST